MCVFAGVPYEECLRLSVPEARCVCGQVCDLSVTAVYLGHIEENGVVYDLLQVKDDWGVQPFCPRCGREFGGLRFMCRLESVEMAFMVAEG